MNVELARLVKKLSYREGDFTLASGQKSSFYVDLKATTLHPEGADLVGRAAVALIRERGLSIQGVGGLTLGADPIATSVSLAAYREGLHWPAFIVRKDVKGHGTSKSIEGTENLPSGGSLLVLEDVTTTGGSALQAVERVREAGYRCAGVLTIVDREQGGAAAFEKAGVPFFRLLTLEQVRKA